METSYSLCIEQPTTKEMEVWMKEKRVRTDERNLVLGSFFFFLNVISACLTLIGKIVQLSSREDYLNHFSPVQVELQCSISTKGICLLLYFTSPYHSILSSSSPSYLFITLRAISWPFNFSSPAALPSMSPICLPPFLSLTYLSLSGCKQSINGFKLTDQ